MHGVSDLSGGTQLVMGKARPQLKHTPLDFHSWVMFPIFPSRCLGPAEKDDLSLNENKDASGWV